MKNLVGRMPCLIALLIIGIHSLSVGQENSTAKTDDGFIDLFDGVSLNGWQGDPSRWRVENGLLVGEVVPGRLLDRNSFLIWEGAAPGNFELVVEYLISAGGNSGINYRSERVPGVPFALKGYQADIDGMDVYTGQNYEERARTILASRGQRVELPPVEGSIADLVKNNNWTASVETGSFGDREELKRTIKQNDWNEVRIVARGNHLRHYVNGVLMSEVIDNDKRNRKLSGLIGVQVHVGPPMKIFYRNMRLKVLEE